MAGVLPATVERAWRALVDWEAQATWMLDADSVRVLGHRREGVGTRVAVRTRVLHVPLFTEVLEVTRWAPGEGLDIRHTGWIGGVGRWRLRPRPGGTEFLWEEELRLPVPLLGEAMLRLYRPVMRVLMRRAIGGLAAMLAREGATPTGSG